MATATSAALANAVLRLPSAVSGGWDSIRTRLVALAVVATLPLLILAGQDLASARQDAQTEALRVAQLQANLVDEHLEGVDTMLRGLTAAIAARPIGCHVSNGGICRPARR